MDGIVIYESLTGRTARAAQLIAAGLTEQGVPTVACPITDIDYQALARADLVVVGSWVDGIFVVGQRPGRRARIAAMPTLAGKRAVVYLTYALDAGKALDKLASTVEDRGADVLGGLTIRRDRIDEGAADLVERILGAVAPT